MAVRGKGSGDPTKKPQTGPKPKKKKGDATDLEQSEGMKQLAAETAQVDAKKAAAKQQEDDRLEGEPIDLNTEAGSACLFINYRAWKTVKKILDDADNARRAADKKLKTLQKTLVAEIGKDAVELMQFMFAIEKKDGAEKIKGEVDRRVLILRAMTNMHIAQEVFPQFDPRPLEEVAYQLGKTHGMLRVPFQSVYGQGTVAADKYREGHIAGEKLSTTEGAQESYQAQQGPTRVGPPSQPSLLN